MSSGGGGAQSGVTRYEWTPEMAGWWGGENGLLSKAGALTARPYQQYGGAGYNQNIDSARARVAGMDQAHNDAQNQIYSTVRGSKGLGDDTTVAGQGYIQQMLAGNKGNQYAGDNPFFRSSLQSGLQDITDAYKQGTAADTTRQFALSGAFGGSAHQNAVANNESALARNLSRAANEAYQQQFDRSANLQESNLNRQMSAVPLAYQSQGLGFERANQLMNLGNFKRGYQQQLNDAAYGSWQEGQNWERGNMNWLANLLSQAQGASGQSSQTGGYSPTNYGSTALGLGLLGRSAGLF